MSDDQPVTAGDINPYAAPQVGDGLEPFAEAGVGVWRDGDLVVMHERAELPPYCVKTGGPTTGRLTTKVSGWASETSWSTGECHIAVPIAQAWRRWLLRCHRVAAPWILPSFMLGIVAATLEWITIRQAISAGVEPIESMFGGLAANLLVAFTLIIVGFLTGGFLVMMALLHGQPLAGVRRQGHYLWLRGAEPSFLNRLPVWPYGK